MNISEKLLFWYRLNKRDLPWRKTTNPYFIWLSEIILQQTRVDQGMAYYLKFLKHFPEITSLAEAEEEEVLRLWQGLGYYSRARNMHHTAREVVEKYNGKFPDDYTAILKLKGIGPYSAAAIGSFAFGLPHAVVDGNVYRFLSRYFGITTPIDSTIGKKEFHEIANSILPSQEAGEFNQAIMEFGALQCVPRNPACNHCIFEATCAGHRQNLVHDLPVKSKKIKQRNRYFNYLFIEENDKFLIKKRNDRDIWKNLYDFPLLEFSRNLTTNELVDSEFWKSIVGESAVEVQNESGLMIHQLSHQKINAIFWHVKSLSPLMLDNKDFMLVTMGEIDRYPLPKLIVNYLNSKN